MTSEERIKKLTLIKNRLMDINLEVIKVEPWVPINIKGTICKLEFSFGAVLDVFRERGINLNLDSLSPLALQNDPELLGCLLFHGLKIHSELVYENQDAVLRDLNPRYVLYYVTCIMKALTAIQPDEEELRAVLGDLSGLKEEEQPAPLATMPTSSSSGEDVAILDAPM